MPKQYTLSNSITFEFKVFSKFDDYACRNTVSKHCEVSLNFQRNLQAIVRENTTEYGKS